MSELKKSERSESKLQTVHNAYKIRTSVTKLVENNFYFDLNKINKVVEDNTKYITDEKIKEETKKKIYQYFDNQVARMTDKVINAACGINEHLRNANTIFPTYKSEFEERRLELDRAMSCCNVLQDELQYAGECLYANLNKFMVLVLEIQKEFNMIKKLRQADNRFLKSIKD